MASNFAYADSKTPYIDMYNDYMKEQQGIRDAYRKQLETDRLAAESKSNAEYDSAARQNYINYMQTKKGLASQLNALGIRGGASESSALRLGTTYGSNVANNEAARNAALASLRQQYEDKLASYDEEWDNKLQQAYLTAIENQLKWEQEQKAAEEEKKKNSGGGGSRRSYSSRRSGGGGGNNNNASDSRWQNMNDYYSANADKMRNYKNTRTTNGNKKKSSNKVSTKLWANNWSR